MDSTNYTIGNGSASLGNQLEDFDNYLVLNNTVAVLYIFLVLLPSLFFNGSIIVLFAKRKDLQTPLNLLTVSQCCSGIFSNIINPFFFLVIYPITLSYGSCTIEPVVLGIEAWTHYGINALNLAAISVGIYITLKFGTNVLTYRKVLIVITVNWVYPALWSVVLAYIVSEIPSHRCLAYTDTVIWNELTNTTGFPFSIDMVLPFIARDLAIDMVTRALVAITCLASYRLFKRTMINPPEGLSRRMLLLPVLMTTLLTVVTLFTGVLLIGINGGYGNIPVSVEEYEDSPFFYIHVIALVLVEYDSLIYVLLLLYLNTKIQSEFKSVVKMLASKHKMFCYQSICGFRSRNKVVPVNTTTEDQEQL